jgi:hypothetical protein
MPSARTSVGNKEYEGKRNKCRGKKERAASLQQAGNRRETVSFGDAAVAVALRHAIDHTRVQNLASTVLFEIICRRRAERVWTASRPYSRALVRRWQRGDSHAGAPWSVRLRGLREKSMGRCAPISCRHCVRAPPARPAPSVFCDGPGGHAFRNIRTAKTCKISCAH